MAAGARTHRQRQTLGLRANGVGSQASGVHLLITVATITASRRPIGAAPVPGSLRNANTSRRGVLAPLAWNPEGGPPGLSELGEITPSLRLSGPMLPNKATRRLPNMVSYRGPVTRTRLGSPPDPPRGSPASNAGREVGRRVRDTRHPWRGPAIGPSRKRVQTCNTLVEGTAGG